MPSLRLAALALLVPLSLAACGTGSDDAESASDGAAEETANDTITVKTDFGEIELPTEPERAMGMYTTDVDLLLALGYELADSQPIRGDSGYTDFPEFFPQEALAGVEPFANYPEYNFEAIAGGRPDFILNGLGYDDKTVSQLPKIAPTYSVDAFDGQSWVTHFEETAKALGRTEQYDAWVDAYEERLAEVKEAIGDAGDGLVVAPIGYWEGKFTSACYTSVECKAFDDLGLTIYPGAKEKGGEGVELSPEEVDRLKDVDVAFTIIGAGEAGEKQFDQMFAELKKNKLLAQLPFVKNDRVVPYDMEMTFGSPSGQMAFLDVVEKALSQG